jgi:hypothetical protein
LLADRWHTCFFDLDGQQGLPGQVQGRTADDAACWLAGATPAWRDAIRVVCIDLCGIYAAAFARDVITTVRPGGQERAKNLLWAAGKLADYALGLGLEAVPDVVLHPFRA